MCQILDAVIDGEINTKEQAAAILAEESPQYAGALGITDDAARRQLQDDIGRAAGYLSEAEAARIKEMFECPSPVPNAE